MFIYLHLWPSKRNLSHWVVIPKPATATDLVLRKSYELGYLLAILCSAQNAIPLGGAATPTLELALVMASTMSSHPPAHTHERWHVLNMHKIPCMTVMAVQASEGHNGTSSSGKDLIFPQTAINTRPEHQAGVKICRASRDGLVQGFSTTSNPGILFWK